MKNIFTDLSKTISLACVMAGVVSTLPVSAVQMSFDETTSDSGLAAPLSESCALHSGSNLRSHLSGENTQNNGLNLEPNLLASSDLGAAQGEQISTSPSFEDDCCAVGGIEAVGGPIYNGGAFCDVGGVLPAGGIAAAPAQGGFPFPVLAALAPAAGVPLLLSGGESSTPTAQPSSVSKSSPNPTSGSKSNPDSNLNPGLQGNLASNPPSEPLTSTADSSTEKAPEPSTMAGLLIGGAMFGAYRKRKRNSEA